jgi:hypothetical protein
MSRKLFAPAMEWSKSPGMKPPSDDFDPTEVDLDLIVEGVTGKPVKPANLATGIASMQKRITQLEMEKAKLIEQLEIATEDAAGFDQSFASLNSELKIARERLVSYQNLLRSQN